MTRTKPRVIVTRKLLDAIETRMMELLEVRRNRNEKPMSREDIAAEMQEADVLVPTKTDRIDAACSTRRATSSSLSRPSAWGLTI